MIHGLPVSAVLAYLDPNSGSMMLQVLLGGSAAVLVILRLCWRHLVRSQESGVRSQESTSPKR